jgi:DNA replication protein DnaC
MLGDKEFFSLLCDDCYNSPERKAEQQAEHLANIRRQRIEKSNRRRNILSSVIPPLYRDAHIRKLPEIIRKTFFALGPSKGLFLSGSVGVGKTFALYAISRYLICKGRDILFYRFEDLLNDFRDSYNSDNEINEQLLRDRLKNVRYLIIDDIGTSTRLNPESDFSLRTVYNIIDHRINYCLPTFLSTNKTVEELSESFDQRIFSRIAGSCEVLNLSGKDKRLNKKILMHR